MTSSIGDDCRVNARERPDRIAFRADDLELTNRELDGYSDTLAAWLADHGTTTGDRVGYLGRNHLLYPIVAVAASKLGAICVGLNWRLSPSELQAVLGDAEPTVVFSDDEFATTARSAIDGLDTPPELVPIGRDPGDLPLLAAPRTVEVCAGDPDLVASITYTSGTTGRPKGVMTSNRALLGHLDIEMPWAPFDDESIAFVVSPVFHAVGSVWTAMAIHNRVPATLVPDPDPATVLEVIERDHITHGVVVPALLQVLLDHPDREQRDLTSLRALVYGASPISERLLERAAELLPWCGLAQGYGMTETTGPVTFLAPDEHIVGSPLLRSAGRAAEGTEVRVVDLDEGGPTSAGEPGEVQVRSEHLCDGYWRNPEETAALFTVDGWLRTGDIGVFDDAGYLTLTDRVKDVIVSGGENVYSGEVERVLLQIEGITQACVVGAPHPKWGETVVAVLVAGDAAPDVDEVIAHCRESLAHYKCPTAVHFVDDLPKNPAGKTLRRLVRDDVVGGQVR